MGLVRNLKKTLTNLAEKILVELSYHYIKQRAKQTLRRPDNYLSMEYSQKHLTQEDLHSTIATSSTGISEKITMETQIESEPVAFVREWAINKIELLHDADRHKNAQALLAEFDEWINIPDGVDQLDYLCLEDQDWTDDQEIDVR
jgi:hypothetical protein